MGDLTTSISVEKRTASKNVYATWRVQLKFKTLSTNLTGPFGQGRDEYKGILG
jgi:hypothetical protein